MLSNTDLFVITYHDDYVEIRNFKMQRIIAAWNILFIIPWLSVSI